MESETHIHSQELCTIPNEKVSALHLTADKIIFGCHSGNVYGLMAPGTRTPFPLFRNHAPHGKVVGVAYERDSNILVVGYEEGTVHIKKCTMNLAANNCWRMYCECVSANSGRLHSVLTLCPEEGVMEVWLGCDGARVEVWRVREEDMLVPGRLGRRTIVVEVTPEECGGQGGGAVVLMRPTPDNTRVVALLEVPTSPQSVLVTLDTECKTLVGSWIMPFQGQLNY